MRLTASTSGSESDSSSSGSSGAGASPGADDTAGSITALISLGSTDESSGGTMAERMQQQFEEKQNASQEVVAFKQRQQRRKEYMGQQGQVGAGRRSGWEKLLQWVGCGMCCDTLRFAEQLDVGGTLH